MWSQVFAAGRPDQPTSVDALNSLCRLYWYPIYAFLRRCGHESQNARDLTQGFFVYLIEANLLKKATPDRGRFRSFLLGTLKNFVSNLQARENALKRGGGARLISIDEQMAEGRYEHEPSVGQSPEKFFDRRWALTVIGEALGRLEAEYRRAGAVGLFAMLQPYLTGDQEDGLDDLAARLNKSPATTRVTVFRLRHRFRKLIREVVADTVADPDQVEKELAHLQASLRED
jgi:hypothetical protein